mmetsp:Transcript_28342/g.47558  ORF Transcript_28342/g.47558 Transcript_28342/m.47558 type:complete len:210 (-) Transcript_28342:488-1117(-)
MTRRSSTRSKGPTGRSSSGWEMTRSATSAFLQRVTRLGVTYQYALIGHACLNPSLAKCRRTLSAMATPFFSSAASMSWRMTSLKGSSSTSFVLRSTFTHVSLSDCTCRGGGSRIREGCWHPGRIAANVHLWARKTSRSAWTKRRPKSLPRCAKSSDTMSTCKKPPRSCCRCTSALTVSRPDTLLERRFPLSSQKNCPTCCSSSLTVSTT